VTSAQGDAVGAPGKVQVAPVVESLLAQCTDPTGRAEVEKLLGRLGQSGSAGG